LLADGHVKWLAGQKVSGGLPSPSASAAATTGDADGTMTLGGSTETTTTSIYIVTFSPA
jgi:hypothetical protein